VPDDAPPTRLELIALVRSIAKGVRGTLAGELGDSSISGLTDDASELARTLTEALDARMVNEHRRLPVCKSGWEADEAIFEGASCRIANEKAPEWLAWLAKERRDLA